MATIQSKNKNKKRKRNGKVYFENESVTKEVATEFLLERNHSELTDIKVTVNIQENDLIKQEKVETKNVKKNIKNDNNEEPIIKKKKKLKKVDNVQSPEADVDTTPNGDEIVDQGKNNAKESKSNREQKRIKHANMLEGKKQKVELALQQKSLNYLSKWKHSKDDWKFEKLKQIWLIQNMYNSKKVAPSFWDVLVQYFSNCKGLARKTILDKALKIIETENDLCDNDSEESSNKLTRARDIIQHLQE